MSWETITGTSHVVQLGDDDYPGFRPGDRVVRLEALTTQPRRIGFTFVIDEVAEERAVIDLFTHHMDRAVRELEKWPVR